MSESIIKQKMAERMKKLQELHKKRNEARLHNHQEVVAEDERNQLPSNWESRKKQAEWLKKDQEAREAAKQQGIDYDRQKLLQLSAMDAERIEKKLKKKKNPDPGFADYEQACVRKYQKLVKGMPPKNMERYETEKKRLGEAFYGGAHTILQGLEQDRKEAVDNMVKDLEQQINKREKYSRRRTHNDDADIDYINERNCKFNKKLERFYGEYTAEIKQNLERGTAV